MATQHQVLNVRQRFGEGEGNLGGVGTGYTRVRFGEPGPPLAFVLATPARECFVLVEGYDLERGGLAVLLDGEKVAVIDRGASGGWATRLVPLPAMASGRHRLQFAALDRADASLVSHAVLHWLPGDGAPPPFPPEVEEVVLRGWVNLDVQRQLGGKPDGDTLWLLDASVVQDVRGVGAALVADEEVNRRRDFAGGTLRRLRIRLQGIDTPELHLNGPGGESKQNYGFLALQKLQRLGGGFFFGSPAAATVEVRCALIRRAGRETVLDPNDRVLGYVFLEDLDVNVELVRSGLAFPYLFDSLSTAMQQRLRQEAQSASAAALGLWRDYTPLPQEAQPAREPFSDDPGPVNFPAFWRRWVEYRSGGGEPGPGFVEFVRAGRDRALSVPLGERRLFSDLIDPLTNRLLVNPWEPVFAEDSSP